MNGIFVIWTSVNNRRGWARLRSYCPCLFYLPGFMVGQLLGYWMSVWGLILLMIWTAARWFIIGGCKWTLWRGTFMISMTAGIISFLARFPQELPQAAGGVYNLRVKVEEAPRYRRPGEVELSLLVLEASNQAEGSQEQRLGEKFIFAAALLQKRVLCRAVDLPWRNIASVQEGSQLEVAALVQPYLKPFNPFAYTATQMRRGHSAACRIYYASRPWQATLPLRSRLRRFITDKVVGVLGDREPTGLLLAMGIGVRDRLSDRTESAFKRTGLAHLLVVSGYQVTLVYYAIWKLFQWVLMRVRWLLSAGYVPAVARIAALMASLGFVALVGIEGSSLRAALAIILVVVGHSLERGGGMLNAIVVSFLAISLIWPGAYFEPGLQLTYAALLGLALGFGGKRSAWQRYLAGCAYASFFTSFTTLCWFGQLSLIGFVLNPIVAPIAAALSCKAGFIALIAYLMGVDKSGLLLQVTAELLGWFRTWVLWIGNQSYAAIEPTGWWFGVLVAGTAIFAVRSLWFRYFEFLLEENVFVTPGKCVYVPIRSPKTLPL